MIEAAALLAGKGIRPSYQRLRILEYLAGTSAHPSVETIYRSLAPEIPTLSRTTVYNTLSLFEKSGLAVPIYIDGEELRWDGDVSEHGHFRCRSCGGIFDFPVTGSAHPALAPGFVVELAQLYCVGLCPACAPANAPA
jgi:Fur family transcriptional regulator, peroxide stress response regulator